MISTVNYVSVISIVYGEGFVPSGEIATMGEEMQITPNRRSTPRKELQLDVDIFACGTYLGRTTTRDIHADGAFIEAGADEVLVNDVVDLRFIPEENEIKPVRLRAMVVRDGRDGVGVLFGYGEMDFRRLLKKLC